MARDRLLDILDQAAREEWKKLDLSRKGLVALPPEIGRLTNLKRLDLTGNQIVSLPPQIEQLTGLRELIYARNRLSDLPPEIFQLSNLEVLDLNGNPLGSLPEGLFQLTNLQELSLMGAELSALAPEIARLASLKTLHLKGNQLTALPAEIGQLTGLRMLSLSFNPLSALPQEIAGLTNLLRLELSATRMTALPPESLQLTSLRTLSFTNSQLNFLSAGIGQLQQLQFLDVADNELSALPEEIGQLGGLEVLILRNNQLTVLPDTIGQLANLQRLDLSSNPLSVLPAEVTRLEKLKELDLSGTRLETLPVEISRLGNMQTLILIGNQLNTLPPEIGQLTELKTLSLSDNALNALPPEIGQLANLQTLYLDRNQLRDLPEEIGQLTSLQELDFMSNQISTLPSEITQLTNLKELNLLFNAITEPPLEVAEDGVEAIRAYFRQKAKVGTMRLFEAKLLIVGEPGAGKTTLARKLLDRDYPLNPDEDTTEGIDIHAWDFATPEGNTFSANLWDFGGQQIYHATHQFFLTRRSLYVLVADAREENTDFFFWLNAIELLSDGSPVVIVMNEKQDRKRAINEPALRGRFENLREVLAVNLATGRGLDEMVEVLQHQLCRLPHVGTDLPATWVRVREALEMDSRDYIPVKEFQKICKANGFGSRKDALQLSDYLHDIGVFLHFQEDPLLKRIVILNPEWGTDAVYRVLDDTEVINNQGRFTRDDLARIWDDVRYDGCEEELLRLMMNFELCYEIPGNTGTLIAPQLLSEAPSQYDWDAGDGSRLQLRYRYEFMPRGILARFIVAVNELILNHLAWKSGVVLHKDGARSEVIEQYDRREIRIRLYGARARDLLVIIMYELDRIHASFGRLKVSKLVPCNCTVCQEQDRPHFFTYEDLRVRLDHGRETIECNKPPFEAVSVLALLDSIGERSMGRDRPGRGDTHIHVEGDYVDTGGGAYVGGDVDSGGGDFTGRDRK